MQNLEDARTGSGSRGFNVATERRGALTELLPAGIEAGGGGWAGAGGTPRRRVVGALPGPRFQEAERSCQPG